MARRRKIKKHTAIRILIAVVAIILIVAIALGIFYLAAPEKFNELKDELISLVLPQDTPGGETPDRPVTPEEPETPEEPVTPEEPETPEEPDVQPTLEGTLEMTVIDIGQGDCIFLQFPDGQTMIMDAGSEFASANEYDQLTAHLDMRGVEYLDYIFITHSDYDHIRYMQYILEDYEVKNIYMPMVADDMSVTWTKTVAAIEAETWTNEEGEQTPSSVFYTVGDFVIEGENWVMSCHSYLEEDYPNVRQNSSAEIKNSVSPICFLEYADRTIVLTGDSNERNEEYLTERGVLNVDADVLKVGHHGSRTSTIQQFLDAVDCEYAIISYGEDNDYGHPTPELMSRLQNYTDPTPDGDYNGFKYIYETPLDGNVSVYVDGDGTLRIDCENTDEKDFTLEWGVTAQAAMAADMILPAARRDEVQLAA